MLATTYPQLPIHLCCQIIDQATTTLNLMRPSRINPRLSDKSQLNGAFDYNTTPFIPLTPEFLFTKNSTNAKPVNHMESTVSILDEHHKFTAATEFTSPKPHLNESPIQSISPLPILKCPKLIVLMPPWKHPLP